ncbi:hypothetical protein L6R52_39390 [Myxococcota bacterium]|nr:hypothetical protein [Myxococcota bacterium]
MSTTGTAKRTPAVNVFESPTEVVVLAAIPVPVNARDANVTYGNGVLTLVLPRAPDFVSATLGVPKTGGARGSRQGH